LVVFLLQKSDFLNCLISGMEIITLCCWCDSPPVCQGLLIHEVSRSHTTTHHSR